MFVLDKRIQPPNNSILETIYYIYSTQNACIHVHFNLDKTFIKLSQDFFLCKPLVTNINKNYCINFRFNLNLRDFALKNPMK